MCLLAGCDYLPNVPGLGIKTAFKLVKQHRTYKKVRGWLCVRGHVKGSIGMLLLLLTTHTTPYP